MTNDGLLSQASTLAHTFLKASWKSTGKTYSWWLGDPTQPRERGPLIRCEQHGVVVVY